MIVFFNCSHGSVATATNGYFTHGYGTANKGLAELIVAKQRNGPTGVVKLTWDDKTTRFKNFDWRHAGDFAAPYDASSSSGPASGPAPGPTPPQTFAPGNKAGPVSDFRDGGGPDTDFDDDELPPF